MRVLKGHGTENDFIVVPDLDGAVRLTPELVRALCDRHAGIGADGVLRVVRCAAEPEAQQYADRCEFFMDYRNADGSLAEMCGNGVRVFMQYLQRVSLVGQDAAVATRGGIVCVRADVDGEITVEMGRPQVLADRPVATVAQSAGQPGGPAAGLAGTAVLMPNPHVVVPLPSGLGLDSLNLSGPPEIVPPMPQGQNVEFVVRAGPRHLGMRVHERGVGETRSCGTGICAVVAAIAEADGVGADGSRWRVDIPGGSCAVLWRVDGVIELTGPAQIVAEIELDDDWLAARTNALSAVAAE